MTSILLSTNGPERLWFENLGNARTQAYAVVDNRARQGLTGSEQSR
jgi:hypothetical protein